GAREVPAGAEMAVGMVESVLHGLLVGLVVADDALLHFVDRELASVDRLPGVEDAPDEPDAELRLPAADRRTRPRAFEQRGVDIEDRAIGIDVASRKTRRDQRRAQGRTGSVELVHEGVLALTQRLESHGRPEILGILGAAVR